MSVIGGFSVGVAPALEPKINEYATIVNSVRGIGQNMMIINLVVDEEERDIVHTMRRMATIKQLPH